MRSSVHIAVPAISGFAAASLSFIATAGAQGLDPASVSETREAIFAGGCFWCVESDFDKFDGVVETISGYAGGNTQNPTYKDVTYGDTGHYEAVKIVYDPSRVSYEELVSHFFRTIDPTDDTGQFCDKGDSYRTAVFTSSLEQLSVARAEIRAIDQSGVLPVAVVTKVVEDAAFYPAEDYHQDYYQKNPLRYKFYREACGRDKRVEELWGADVSG